MLKQRVITALVLVAILLPALAMDVSWPFAVLTLLFISAAGWEWSRLNEAPGLRAVLLGAAVAGASVYLAYISHLAVWGEGAVPHEGVQAHVHEPGEPLVGFAVPSWLWWGATAVWVIGGALALRYGTAHWRVAPQLLRRFLGLVLLAVAWLAMVESKLQGINFLLSIFCLVWAADIGAYFGGRTFGRNKLAPTISPGKSWEGVVAGVVVVCLLAAGWIAVDQMGWADSPSLYSHLWAGLGPIGMPVALIFLCAMSVVGDLFESLVKRQAGAKDSSQLLPGHGGVLDRIDALLPVFPVALAVLTFCHG